jgi:hypothetical protein
MLSSLDFDVLYDYLEIRYGSTTSNLFRMKTIGGTT